MSSEIQTVSFQKSVEIYDSADIIVAGGGPSGVAAAVAAARQGRKVILLEQSGTLGGSSVLAMVAELMNFDDGAKFIVNGIGREIFDNLGLKTENKREWHNVRYEQLKRVYDKLVLDAGVEVMFYTKLIDTVCENGKIEYAVVSTPSGISAVKGKFYIDCTGSGILSQFAGADYLYGNEKGETMSATICTLWGGVDFSKKGNWDAQHYKRAFEDGVFSQYDSVLPGIKENYPEINVGGGNVGHCFLVDDRDVKSLSKAMFEGRKILAEYEYYYRNYINGCKDATIIKSADFIGIRESRRVVCEYTLTFESFYSQESFPDEIGRYSYPIDIHPITPDKEGMRGFVKAVSMKHQSGETYSIPYRCLVPKKVDNLLIAGRCIGTDREMQASTRVIPCCYITGQAAGVAAAVCIENKTSAKDADIIAIQNKIKEL